MIDNLKNLVMYSKEFSNGNKKAIINRSLLADGFNYYVSLFIYSSLFKQWFWIDSYQQGKTILSEKEAIKKAKTAII